MYNRRYKINSREVFGLIQYFARRFHRFARALNMPRVEHIYVFFSITPNFFWVAKVGISQGAETRVKQVEESVSNLLRREVKLWRICVPVLFARKIEALLHRLFQSKYTPLYWRYRELAGTSGHTEWFGYLNPVFSIIVLFVWWYLGKPSIAWAFGAALVLPAPIDFCIFVLLICVCQWAVIGCGLWWAFKIIFVI